MTNLYKKILIITICLFLSFSIFANLLSFATEENIDENDIETTSIQENEEEGPQTRIYETTEGSASTLTPSSSTTVSSMNTYQEANLSLNNILCVILIAIAVVILLLAIAILIKIKR